MWIDAQLFLVISIEDILYLVSGKVATYKTVQANDVRYSLLKQFFRVFIVNLRYGTGTYSKQVLLRVKGGVTAKQYPPFTARLSWVTPAATSTDSGTLEG